MSGDWSTVSALAQAWLGLDPGNQGAAYLGLLAYDHLGRFDVGYRTYRAGLQGPPTTFPGGLDVRAYAGALSRRHPDSARILQVAAGMFAEIARAEQATKTAAKAASLAPDDPYSWIACGDAYRLCAPPGWADRAVEYYTHALVLDPKSATAYCDRGLVYEAVEMGDTARRDFSTAERLAPSVAGRIIEAKREDSKRAASLAR
jgi:tetratricopeptide (TPR) repeat protein